MVGYCIAGHDLDLSLHVPELGSLKTSHNDINPTSKPDVYPQKTKRCVEGLINGKLHQVEIRSVPSGILLKVIGGGKFHISTDGRQVTHLNSFVENSNQSKVLLNALDKNTLLGPVLIMALALRGTWCLHASAVQFFEKVIVFLGESGQGKSTLASYLTKNETEWRLVADDILPVTMEKENLHARPRFPQLKLAENSQPWEQLPEKLEISRLCILTPAEGNQSPKLTSLSQGSAIQKLISHTAGSRLFDPGLMEKHLQFCARTAKQVQVSQLFYPHSMQVLPRVKQLLENTCLR